MLFVLVIVRLKAVWFIKAGEVRDVLSGILEQLASLCLYLPRTETLMLSLAGILADQDVSHVFGVS